MSKSNLVSSDNLSPRKINLKKSPYETQTILKSKKSEYEQNGWEEVPSKLKKSIRIRKPKKHDIAFEERVWALFAKMGFDYLNADRQFKLDYGNGLQKQIDVFAFDEETILIVECKSTQERKRGNYSKDINEIGGLKNQLRLSARKLTKKKQKVAFLFCTNNAVIGPNDKTRLEENGIFHFNQDTIEYYEQLTEHLGKAAKYQLFGNLFAGQDIPELKNKIPAIRGKVSAGHTIYSFCIEPEYLLKIGYILHRTDTTSDATQAYQRLVRKNRLKAIGKYIDNNGYFPNSIIINIETKNNKSLNFDHAQKIEHDGSTNCGILHLPKVYKSAFIIDGQHRLLGYSKTAENSNHTIPVVAFHNLPAEEQAKIFIDINRTQKSIPANLLQSIMADSNWNSNNDKLALSALKTRLFTEMNSDDNSPFYKRIILTEEKKTATRCLTLRTLMMWGVNRVNYLGILRKDKLIQQGYLQGDNHDETLQRSKKFFNYCFTYIEEQLPSQWEKGNSEGGFIAMNVGVSAIIRILDDILEFVVEKEGFDPFSLSGEQLAKKTTNYLDSIVSFVKNLDSEGIKKIRGYFGSTAAEKVQREFQNAISQDFPNFNPVGLEQWLRDNSGKFNDPAYNLGHSRIEPMIGNFIELQLKKDFGEHNKNWWIQGIPHPVQKKCAERRIDGGSSEPEENFLDPLDYEAIIKKNSELLLLYFTPPGQENAGKSIKLSWIKKFNKIRQKYSHPQRESITEEELESLEKLERWLSEKLI